MGKSKQARQTKNSQKVASLVEQNKVLEEVLKASREASDRKNKGKPDPNKGNHTVTQDKNGAEESDGISSKRKADSQLETSPAKKPKKDGEGPKEKPSDGPKSHGTTGSGLILEYPDYEANREEDFDEGRQSGEHVIGTVKSAGNRPTSPTSTAIRREETARREHEVSSEEDDIEPFEDPYDNVNEDFLGDELGWDSRSIASSAIFPSQNSREARRTEAGVRPELARSRSQRREDVNKQPSSTRQAPVENSIEIEKLVKERAGADTGKDSVGPPIADCIAELLKSYLKDPSTEAILKLLEQYPRPVNAEWLHFDFNTLRKGAIRQVVNPK